jgi:hypothetical protein
MTKNFAQALSLADVHRLSYGNRTSSKKGSRQIPHRLNNVERTLFEKAKAHGHIWSLSALNPALINTYYNFCCATGRPFICMMHATDEHFEVLMQYPDVTLKDTTSLKYEPQTVALTAALLKALAALDITPSTNATLHLSLEAAKHISKTIRKAAIEHSHAP